MGAHDNSLQYGPGVMLNPLATKYYDPKEMSFVFEEGTRRTVEGLLENFIRQRYRGQIIGPCGTGKSTLLSLLGKELAYRGYSTKRIVLRDAERALPKNWMDGAKDEDVSRNPKHVSSLGTPTQIILLDGAEQLSRWNWMRFRMACRHQGWGILLTTHRVLGGGFAELWNARVTVELARKITTTILSQNPDAPRFVTEDDVPSALQKCNGNMRQTLFELYDLYEARAMRMKY